MKKKLHKIEVCQLVNGHNLCLFLYEFSNNKPGPSLGLSATIHGNEDLNIEIFRRFSLKLENINFRGRIIMLPVANPLALGSYTNRTPIDSNNLAIHFPGSEKGEVTNQIANVIVKEYMPKADYFLDFHSGGTQIIEEHVANYPGSEELGKMTGWKYSYINENRSGEMSPYLAMQKKPMVVIACGGCGQNEKYYIQQGHNVIINIMKYLKMIDGEPNLPEKQYSVKEIVKIITKNGGIFIPNISLDHLNNIVDKNTLLGTMFNPYTFEEIEHFYAPFNKNIIMGLRVNIGRIEVGNLVFSLGNIDTVEQI